MKTLTGLGRIALLIVTMGSLLCSIPANTHAQDSDKHTSEKKTVLLISSYHPGFPTFFQQIDGIKSVFENTNIDLDVEFMDSKRFYTKTNLDNFFRATTYKLSNTRAYDAIIVSDDNAFTFALDHQAGLSDNIPIVFCGVNNMDKALAQNKNSHDPRAPLRHIDGFIELLEKKAETAQDEQSRHYMETISDPAEKMGRLIDDLLSFSRMGRQAMAFQQVDLRVLVRDVIRDLEPDTAGRTIDWRIGDLPSVEGDAAMMRMVLDNLITNALKFTRPREEARIEIGSQPDQNAETVIYVRDNGVGFDMTYADKLFGVFQRLHRADEFEGTGIGLANVRRIIARHNGRTWAEGGVDQGSTFYFSLPQTQQGGDHAGA